MTNNYQRNLPILLLDIVDYSKYEGAEPKKRVMQKLQQLMAESARFFMPYGDPFERWRRHGTGDGYYFPLDASLGPQVALEYALKVLSALEAYNASADALAIKVRLVLAYGDLEIVEDQILSEAFIVAERLISYQPFKEFARSQSAGAIAATALFIDQYRESAANQRLFSAHESLPWTKITATDKHNLAHHGYVCAREFIDQAVAPAPSKAFQVTILTAHSVRRPLPQAVEMAKATANEFLASGLEVVLRFDAASVAGFRRTARAGCDLLIFYGHGGDDGTLRLVDAAFTLDQLNGQHSDIQSFWTQLQGCILFACYGARFAENLPCPWIAFDDLVNRLAPKAFMHHLVQSLAIHSLPVAIQEARRRSAEEPSP